MCSVHSGVERETGPWRTNSCCLSPQTACCQGKKHVQVVYKGVCLLSSRGAHLANEVRSVQICLLWERRGDLSSSVSCCWVREHWGTARCECTFNIYFCCVPVLPVMYSACFISKDPSQTLAKIHNCINVLDSSLPPIILLQAESSGSFQVVCGLCMLLIGARLYGLQSGLCCSSRFHFGALYYGVTVAKMQRYGLDM